MSGLPPNPSSEARASQHRWLMVAHTAAIFLSAALLFAVQPMFTKMVLPKLGGAPAVWSVAMVFFQATLLAGYAYAHLLTRYAPGRRSVFIHLAVMIVAAFTLPLSIASGWGRPPAVGEAFWLLGLFAVSIGLPFFALSANGPMLQAWFARTDHPAAKDPYFLYAASNVGSFLALVSYPFLVEPFIRLGDQTRLWSLGYFLLIALIAGCGWLLARSPDQAPSATSVDAAGTDAPPSWRDAAIWVALAAVPSALLVAVTAHISTDVAAVPLLWVIPLALYLATFVNVFSRRPLIPHWLAVNVQPFVILGLLAVIVFNPISSIEGLIAVHVLAFFVFTLVCHGELARRRPAPRYLTYFYMWMSAGGMIGGILAGLVAPHVFNWVMEYPILIALAVLCRPGVWLPQARAERYAHVGVLVAIVLALIAWKAFDLQISERTFNWTVGAVLVGSVALWHAPLPFAAAVAFILASYNFYLDTGSGIQVRSFFGVHKITDNGEFRVLTHGTTIHGGQRVRDADGNPLTGRPEISMYYYDGSAIAQIMDAVRARKAAPIRYAVIGLGAGSLACRAEPADTVHYYEIDPAIIKTATNPNIFTFISECRPDVPIILGDARLTLADAEDGSYDFIMVDAFSSDAIPIHLLTREAMAIYQKKLTPHGVVSIHVSNRHLELASVVAGIAAANGMITRVNDGGDVEEDDNNYIFVGQVTAVARTDEDFGKLTESEFWPVLQPDPNQWVWTDDYSNIVGSLWRKHLE